MNWLALVQALAPVAISIAESVHPLPNSGKQKLATATTLVTLGLGVASAAGSIPPEAATDVRAVTTIINQQVAQLNNTSGVPKLPK